MLQIHQGPEATSHGRTCASFKSWSHSSRTKIDKASNRVSKPGHFRASIYVSIMHVFSLLDNLKIINHPIFIDWINQTWKSTDFMLQDATSHQFPVWKFELPLLLSGHAAWPRSVRSTSRRCPPKSVAVDGEWRFHPSGSWRSCLGLQEVWEMKLHNISIELFASKATCKVLFIDFPWSSMMFPSSGRNKKHQPQKRCRSWTTTKSNHSFFIFLYLNFYVFLVQYGTGS